MRDHRGPGQRAGLTRAALLTAARDLVAEAGIERLTMRALADRLDVAPNALYSHIENKTNLIEVLLDDLLADVEAPSPDVADPVAGINTMMISTYRILTAHADLVPLYLTRQGARGPNAVRLGDILDALLRRAGVPASAIGEARRVLIIHAIGSAAFAVTAPDSGRPIPTSTADRTFTTSIRWLVTGITTETRQKTRRRSKATTPAGRTRR